MTSHVHYSVYSCYVEESRLDLLVFGANGSSLLTLTASSIITARAHKPISHINISTPICLQKQWTLPFEVREHPIEHFSQHCSETVLTVYDNTTDTAVTSLLFWFNYVGGGQRHVLYNKTWLPFLFWRAVCSTKLASSSAWSRLWGVLGGVSRQDGSRARLLW